MGSPGSAALFVGVAAVACGGDTRHYMTIDAPGPDAERFDAAHVDAPADARVDAPPDAPPVPSHLLLTEVELGSDGAQFIELMNPTTAPISLDGYFLSNNGEYWKTPLGSAGYTVGNGDFVVRFTGSGSDGTIASGQVMVVAVSTAQAFGDFSGGVVPTFSIADRTVATVFGNGSAAVLAATGTAIALFAWDGSAATVQDVDLMTVGQPLAANAFVSKSGMAQGSGAYKTEANTLPMQAATPPSGKSTQRQLLEATHEVQNGQGNGITGHDETSEDTTITWDGPSFAAHPTPGTVPAQLLP
jgi:hypothetical protein